MIETANFHGMDNLPDNSQVIACGSDQFAKYFDVSEGKQFREVELPDKELFDIAYLLQYFPLQIEKQID
ncbi:MAG: hypothetical protein EZS28_026474 [Streblomastix strix]|uniref:Uncharacterized protein n=1 Tax=Streblomastix strix TaxID=222440 RepID=A0A5J4V5F2_9EUKA|nr:MAG: hypothetical protein EZS28_026474 [Streblomastix strix]